MKDKIVLIQNVATLRGTTVQDFEGMNELKEKFPDLEILAFPCNQFGHQCNEGAVEIKNMLKYVRPGNGFEFKGKIFKKVYVNGSKADPLFKFLKSECPVPHDSGKDSKQNGADDSNVLVLPRGGFNETCVVVWSPVCRDDIAWNFEKFLVDKSGKVVHRFSRYFPTKDIATYIQTLTSMKET